MSSKFILENLESRNFSGAKESIREVLYSKLDSQLDEKRIEITEKITKNHIKAAAKKVGKNAVTVGKYAAIGAAAGMPGVGIAGGAVGAMSAYNHHRSQNKQQKDKIDMYNKGHSDAIKKLNKEEFFNDIDQMIEEGYTEEEISNFVEQYEDQLNEADSFRLRTKLQLKQSKVDRMRKKSGDAMRKASKYRVKANKKQKELQSHVEKKVSKLRSQIKSTTNE